MKNLRIVALCCALFSLSISPTGHSAIGDIILWPVVTDASVVNTGGQIFEIIATVDMIPMRLTTASLTTPNSLVMKVAGNKNGTYLPWGTDKAYVTYGVPWQTVSDYWLANYGPHSTIVKTLDSNGTGDYRGGCVSLTLDTDNTNNFVTPWSGIIATPSGLAKCTSIPISAYRCQITQSSLTIDYGRVDSAEANGKTASTNFNMNCDGPVNITISSASGPTVYLGSGLTATLSIDGKPLPTSNPPIISVPAGNSVHTLSTTLSASSVQPGSYSSQTALVVNYL